MVLRGFKGSIEQLAPMFSAVKYKGRPLYKWAREGMEIARRPRQVHIYDIEILKKERDQLTLRIACSSGTYIRALAHDIGKIYGTGAALCGLRRTKIGDIDIVDSSDIKGIIGLSENENLPEKCSWIRSLGHLFGGVPALIVKKEHIKKVQNGGRLSKDMLEPGHDALEKASNGKRLFNGMTAVRSTDGRLIAIHRALPEDVTGSPDGFFTKSVVIF